MIIDNNGIIYIVSILRIIRGVRMMNKNLITRGKTIFSRISKKKKIGIGILLVIVLILIGVNYSYYSKVKQADEAMSEQDYDKAVTMYGQALNIFNREDTKSKLSKSEELIESKKAFDEGMKFLDVKNYFDAFLEFKKVIEEDTTNYENALKKQEESKGLCVAQGIKDANNYASANDYENAVSSLYNALAIDSTNKELLDLKNQYTSSRNKALDEANAQAQAKAKADADAKALANAKAAKEYDEQKAKKAEEAKQKRKSEGVRIGMTKDEVLGSNWGQPKSVNKTTGSYGTHEQWVYGGNNYLYFDNGILTSFQN